MNRAVWQQSITKHSCPPWSCPACKKGTLALIPKSLVFNETAESIRSHSDEDWYPEQASYLFTAWLQCRNSNCKEQFAVAGDGGLEPAYDPDGEIQLDEYFQPRVCSPMPDIIEMPAKCPDEVKQELRAAFALFWQSRPACAGRIRVALEHLMTHIGVPKRRRANSGKFADLTLHARIDAFAAEDLNVGSQLMALKWLGNTGSHDRDVSKSDLLDAFEVLEHSLTEIIDQRSSRIASLAKKLAKKHRR